MEFDVELAKRLPLPCLPGYFDLNTTTRVRRFACILTAFRGGRRAS